MKELYLSGTLVTVNKYQFVHKNYIFFKVSQISGQSVEIDEISPLKHL